MNTVDKNQIIKIGSIRTGFVVAGNLAGIALAIKHKTGFLMGVGCFLLGGIIGGGIGYLITLPSATKVVQNIE